MTDNQKKWVERLNTWADGMTDVMLRERRLADATIKEKMEEIAVLREKVAIANKYAHWFAKYPSYIPNPEMLDACIRDRDDWLVANRDGK